MVPYEYVLDKYQFYCNSYGLCVAGASELL